MDMDTPRISGKLLYTALANLRQSLIDEHVKGLMDGASSDTLVKQVQEISQLSDCLNKMQTDKANHTYGYVLESYTYPPVLPIPPMPTFPGGPK